MSIGAGETAIVVVEPVAAPPGVLVERGPVLLEVELQRPAKDADVVLAFANILQPDQLVLDKSVDDETDRPRVARLVGIASRDVLLADSDAIRFRACPLGGIDPFAPPSDDFRRLDVARGVRYRARFVTRLSRARDVQDLRGDVETDLGGMGFEVISIACTERSRVFPAWPGSRLSIWVGHLRWIGREGVDTEKGMTTMHDPIAFEDLVPIEDP